MVKMVFWVYFFAVLYKKKQTPELTMCPDPAFCVRNLTARERGSSKRVLKGHRLQRGVTDWLYRNDPRTGFGSNSPVKVIVNWLQRGAEVP